MARILFLCVICVVFWSSSFSQKDLTDHEIVSMVRSENQGRRISSDLYVSDSFLSAAIKALVDSLAQEFVDSIVVLTASFPGYLSSKVQCTVGPYPAKSIVFWNKAGVTYARKIEGHCSTNLLNSTFPIFDDFSMQRQILKHEVIMQPISRVTLFADGRSEVTIDHMIDHEPNYSFGYSINHETRTFYFSETDIDFKESRFHKYNEGLFSVKWWKRLKILSDSLGF